MPVVANYGRVTVVNPGTAGDPRFGSVMNCAVLDLGANTARIVEFQPPPVTA
jgi:predicted phosphodiesterase